MCQLFGLKRFLPVNLLSMGDWYIKEFLIEDVFFYGLLCHGKSLKKKTLFIKKSLRYMPYLRNRVSLVIVSLMTAKNYGLHSTAAVEIFSGFEPLMMIKRRARWLRNTRWFFFQDMRTSTFCSIMALIPTLFSCEQKKSR